MLMQKLACCLTAHLGRRILDIPTPMSRGNPVNEVTQILGQIEEGDGQAAEKLLPLVYDEAVADLASHPILKSQRSP